MPAGDDRRAFCFFNKVLFGNQAHGLPPLSHQPLLIFTMFQQIQDFDLSRSVPHLMRGENRLCVVAERGRRQVVFFIFSFPLQ